MRLFKLLAATIVCACASSAAAQELGIIEEIRGGAALSGIELYPFTQENYLSVLTPVPSSFDIANLDSLQFQVLLWSPDVGAFDWLGSLRPELGGVINLRGRESLLHAGLNWQIPLGDTFYVELEAGVGIHNGALQGAEPPLRNLGCRGLFHWSYGIGAKLDENWTVTANLQHLSNIIFGCHPNQGINHFGVSLGYKF